MVSTADASGRLCRRSALSGSQVFNLCWVTFGYLNLAFGAGTTPEYRVVSGPDPLAISAAVTVRSRVSLLPGYRLQLTPGCARRQKHHHRRSSNRKPKIQIQNCKIGKVTLVRASMPWSSSLLAQLRRYRILGSSQSTRLLRLPLLALARPDRTALQVHTRSCCL